MTGTFLVRAAAATDVDAIVDLFVAVADEGRWLGAEPPVDRDERRQRFLDMIEAPDDYASIVAVAEGRIIGHAAVDLAPYKVAGLGMMVDAGWRGLGVGSGLVRSAIERAQALGAHKLALQVWPHNAAARRLYARHGFVEEGVLRRQYRRHNGELWDAVIMGLVFDETSPGGPGSS